jgi:hypothetical protein
MTIQERLTTVWKQLTQVPRDRYAELLVIVVVVVALLFAWGVKAGAEARAVHIEVKGFGASYGHNWIREVPKTPEILQIVDPGSGGRFATTITVSALKDTGGAEDVIQAVNQARMPKKELYQSLGMETVQLRERDLLRSEFAYVYVSPDLLNPTVPVVVHGVDYVLPQGDVTYVITCTADEDVFDEAMIELDRFLGSISLG